MQEPGPHPGVQRPGKLTLEVCLAVLGPVVLRPLVTPHGTDVVIADVVIAGVGDPLPPSESGLLLMAGTPVDSAAGSRILEQAAGLGFVAVVVRSFTAADDDDLFTRAERLGLALFETPADIGWRHLSDLIAAAASIGSVTDADVGAEAADLFSLANSIASRVGGAVTIEDPQGRVLAYSSLPDQRIDERRRDSILGRHSPERPENAAEYRKVIQAHGTAVRFDFPDPEVEASRLAVSVQAGAEAVGLIFALDHDPPLDAEAPARLEEAARLTALYVLRSRAQQDPFRWAQAEAFRSLLDGIGSPDALRERVGEAAKGACVVCAVTAADPRPTSPLSTTRTPEVIAVQCRGWNEASVTATVGSTVYGLLPVTVGAPSNESRLRRFATDMVDAVHRSTRQRIRVALSPETSSMDDVHLARRVADRVLTAIGTDGERQVAFLDDVRSRVVLSEIAEREHWMLDFYGGPADRLFAHDEQHGTDYAATLLAYLDAFGKSDVAAKRLLVHENTLRYRVRRLAEAFDLGFDDPDDRLLAWLQLRVRFRGEQPDA